MSFFIIQTKTGIMALTLVHASVHISCRIQ